MAAKFEKANKVTKKSIPANKNEFTNKDLKKFLKENGITHIKIKKF